MGNSLIILSEIYGKNNFIKSICSYYEAKGLKVYCPDILEGRIFPYEKENEAYDYFINRIGFDKYIEIESLIEEIKESHENIFIMGFSVGATLAYRCGKNKEIKGIICYYGSRIRDYKKLDPLCPTLAIFAKEDSFNVRKLTEELSEHKNIQAHVVNGRHGFMDEDQKNFDRDSKQLALQITEEFLNSLNKIKT